MSRREDRALRRQWLVRSAPFELKAVEDVLPTVSVARGTEWLRQGVTRVIIDRDGHHWITFNDESRLRSDETPEEVLQALNDEAALAAMAHGTPAENLLK